MSRPSAQRLEQRDEIESRIRLYRDHVARGEPIRYVPASIELVPRSGRVRRENGAARALRNPLDVPARRLLRRILETADTGLSRPTPRRAPTRRASLTPIGSDPDCGS